MSTYIYKGGVGESGIYVKLVDFKSQFFKNL